MWFCRRVPTFQRKLLPSSSVTLNKEAAGFSKTLVPINQTTRCHITEADNLDTGCHKNHSPHKCLLLQTLQQVGPLNIWLSSLAQPMI
jgi:hypothetical protein